MNAGGPPLPPPPKKGGGKGLLIGGIVGAAVLVGGGVGLYFLLRGGASVFPCNVKSLPEDMRGITKIGAESTPYGVKYSDQPKEAFISDWAQRMCAADDVFEEFVQASGKESGRDIGEIVTKRKDLSKKLECGQKFADKAPKNPAQYHISFGGKKDSKSVSIVLNDLEEYPKGDWAKKAKDKGEHITQAYCFIEKSKYDIDGGDGDKDKKEDRECEWGGDKDKGTRADRGVARIDKTNMWVIGSLDSIKAFGDAFDPDGKHSDKSLEAFGELGGKVKSHDIVSIGTQESGGGLDLIPDGAGSLFALKGDDLEEANKLEEKAKKIDYHWAQGSTATSSSTKTDYYWKCGSDSDAKDLKEILDKLWKLSKTASKESEDKEKEDKDREGPDSKYYKAREKARKGRAKGGRAAMKKDGVEIKQDGAWITLSMTTDIEKEDQEDFGKMMKERWESAAKATASILKGEKVEKDVLKSLGGSDLVDAVDEVVKAADESKKDEKKE